MYEQHDAGTLGGWRGEKCKPRWMFCTNQAELLAALFSAWGETQPAGSAFWGLCLSPSARRGDPTAGAGLVAACSGRWGRRAATSSRGTQTHLPALSSKRQRDGLKSPTLPQQLGRVVLSRLKIYLWAHYYAEQFFIHRESTAAF